MSGASSDVNGYVVRCRRGLLPRMRTPSAARISPSKNARSQTAPTTVDRRSTANIIPTPMDGRCGVQRHLITAVGLLFLMVATNNVVAQTGSGQVGGIVQDASKALVP